MKHIGKSTEFMYGMMYYDTKMYNGMFDIFDQSPFNVFKEEDENSIFDLLDMLN